MPEKVLTIRMSPDDHKALKLYAVLQGRSVQAVVMELIKVELAKQSTGAPPRSHEEFVAELLARRGIDPSSPDHLAALERARADVGRNDDGARSGSERGAA